MNWVKHNGRECPIPWARAGEFEAKQGRCDCEFLSGEDAQKFDWSVITHFRLTHDWIYVTGDGTIPEEIKGAKAGRWESRDRDGKIMREGIPAIGPMCRFNHSCQTGIDIVAVRLISTETAICEEPKPFDKRKEIYEEMLDVETEKQRLTRESWLRYKANHPDPQPVHQIGELGIEEIFAESLRKFEVEIERKRR